MEQTDHEELPVLNSQLAQTFPSESIGLHQRRFSQICKIMLLPGFINFRLLGFVGISAKRVVRFLIINVNTMITSGTFTVYMYGRKVIMLFCCLVL